MLQKCVALALNLFPDLVAELLQVTKACQLSSSTKVFALNLHMFSIFPILVLLTRRSSKGFYFMITLLIFFIFTAYGIWDVWRHGKYS